MNELIHRHVFFGVTFERHNITMIIGMLLCVYFSYHLLQGNRSLLRLMQIERVIVAETIVLSSLQEQRGNLEVKVQMMRPGSVDRDLLEERIQKVLGYASPDDLILHFR